MKLAGYYIFYNLALHPSIIPLLTMNIIVKTLYKISGLLTFTSELIGCVIKLNA
jgi:hypothetical protein